MHNTSMYLILTLKAYQSNFDLLYIYFDETEKFKIQYIIHCTSVAKFKFYEQYNQIP